MKRAAAALAFAALAGSATAQDGRPAILRDVGYDQRLGENVPADIALRDEAGRAVRLGDYLGRRPVVLTLVYYECPMLCTLSLNGLVGAMKALSFDPGKEYEVLTVSFEPKETPEQAAARKKAYLERFRRAGAEAGWHFLTGDAESLARLTKAVGFRYAWDAQTRQYAHPAGVLVLAPEGRIARYLYGVEYAPKDLRFALIEAAAGRIGTPVDRVLLFCYRYDPATGRYSAAILRLMRAGAVATMLALGAYIGIHWRRDRLAARGRAG
jgi:protein SCO1/2